MPAEHFVYRLIPPRPTFQVDLTPAESSVMAEHVGYWQGLTDAGKVLIFGPVNDATGSWGLAVVKAGSEAEVREIGDHDPAVTSGICTYDVGTMAVAILPAGG